MEEVKLDLERARMEREDFRQGMGPGHNGETRDDRLFEFTRLNPQTPVLAIREGTALQYTEGRLTLLGELEGFCFSSDDKSPIAPG